MSPQQEHPEEHQKIIDAHEKATHYFEHAVQNHCAAVEHLKKGDHEKAAHHGYTAYGFASHAKKHAEEAALHHSHEHGHHEPLHSHEQSGSQQ
jgi:hypothetical protein